MSIVDARALEGNSGTGRLIYAVKLNTQADGDVNVTYATSDGTATGGSDYASSSGTVTIAAGTTSAEIGVDVYGDADFEPNETVTMNLGGVSANASLGISSAIGTIVNDDPGGLNDTGIASCSDADTNGLECPQAGFVKQDGEHGRDAFAITNDDSDGLAGFSFTKLDGTGAPLSEQTADYATNPWACVYDNVTGLVWEVKTDDGGLRDKDHTYSWYNVDTTTNGGSSGSFYGGTCAGTLAEDCTTEDYVNSVNAAGLCGYADWRLPTREELRSIVVHGRTNPAIDKDWFVNTQSSEYWTSSPYAKPGDLTDFVWKVDFAWGLVDFGDKLTIEYVRLVRGGR